MEYKNYYPFMINEKKVEFFSTRYTIHHENEYGLSYNGYVLITVDKIEVEKAIKELTETNYYNGINIIEAMEKADIKESEKLKKSVEKWDRIHNICIENENRLKAKIEEIKQYFSDVLSKQYTTGCIVYNKLEESVKRGCFTVYTGYSSWKVIYLNDTPLKQLELLEVK